jgi:hypothetical protein
MGVQIRVTRARITMDKRHGDKAIGRYLSDATCAHSGERGDLLTIGERAVPGGLVDLLHRRADLVTAQRPQQRHRLDRREDQVEAGHSVPGAAQLVRYVLLDVLGSDDLARAPFGKQPLCDVFLDPATFRHRRTTVVLALELRVRRGRHLGQGDLVVVLREPAPQPRLRAGLLERHPRSDSLGDERVRVRSQPLAEQGEHLFFGDDPGHTEIGDPGPSPLARRVAFNRVVRNERIMRRALHIPTGNLTRQVLIAIPRVQHVTRHSHRAGPVAPSPQNTKPTRHPEWICFRYWHSRGFHSRQFQGSGPALLGIRDACSVVTDAPRQGSSTSDHGIARYTVLSHKAITTWAVLIVLVGAGMAAWLLLAYTGGDAEANRVQLDAIRTAGTIVVGTGGAAALLLAARRQRTAEIALKQKDRDQADVTRAHALQERVAAAAEEDAEARRITDLYTKAVDQLGSEKAPVRLGGLYALERLAQDHEEHRQTIVNVLCAYLRMPYTVPGNRPEADAGDHVHAANRERLEEREVRLAAQRLLAHHLRPGAEDRPAATFWTDVSLDLTGATLIEFSLRGCRVRFMACGSADFIGPAGFVGATFTHGADFPFANFADAAHFHSVTFGSSAHFRSATFAREAHFRAANFNGPATFMQATFTGHAHFWSSTFAAGANFVMASFAGPADFQFATFTSDALFHGVTFADDVPKEVEQFWSPPENSTPDDMGTVADVHG